MHFNQIGPTGSSARAVAETLLQGASRIGAKVEFGDASAKARIYNSSTRRPATLFVVTRRGTFYVRSFSRWLGAAAVGPELSERYLHELTNIIGKSPMMASGDAGGRRAMKLMELVAKGARFSPSSRASSRSSGMRRHRRPVEVTDGLL